MANIDLEVVYANKLRKFGFNDGERFQDAFVESVNSAFAEFNSDIFETATLSYLADFAAISNDSGLSDRYASAFNYGIDYHLQESGEYAVEEQVERERKWYIRGIKQARTIYQQETTYVNPLGI